MNNLEFLIKLQDQLTPALAHAASMTDREAAKIVGDFNKMSASIDHAGKKAGWFKEKISGMSVGGLLGGLGIGLGFYKLGEMMHRGMEKAHSLEQAIAQVNASLKSTGHAAGMAFEDVENVAKSIASNSKYGRGEMLQMQSVLLTFPSITKNVFGEASLAIANLSQKMGQDLQSSAVQVGKALQDPERGVTALRRIGVNFNTEQTDVIKKLVANGKLAEAQTKILTELNKEFGGSAKAAFDADPMSRYNKVVSEMDVQMGLAAMEVKAALAPALVWLALKFKHVTTAISESVKWLMEHKRVAIVLGVAIGVLAAAMFYNAIAASIVAAASTVLSGVLGVLAFACNAVAFAFEFMNVTNPIMWIVALIAIIGYVVYAVDGWGKQWDSLMKTLKFGIKSFADYFNITWLVFKDAFMTGLEFIEKGWYKLKSLWDKEGAGASLSKINDEQNKRADEIAKAKGVLGSDLKATKDALKWELGWSGKGLGTITGDLKHALGIGGEGKKHGVDAEKLNAAKAAGPGAMGGDKEGGKTAADKINGGGQKSIVINIAKQIGVETQHIMGGTKEAANEMGSAMKEEFVRLLYSLNGVATN
jgi:hypothetical protein